MNVPSIMEPVNKSVQILLEITLALVILASQFGMDNSVQVYFLNPDMHYNVFYRY